MESLPDCAGRSHAVRLARYWDISSTLALISDRRLGAIVDAAPILSSGIGGTAVLLEIGGRPVFVKRVPLTDIERRPEHVMSTANLFQLPTCYQYGVGSAGFGVWRELAAHTLTTNWVLGRKCADFPLLYHWRVLEGTPSRPPTAEARADLARMVTYWDEAPAVRERLEAVARSSACVALFLEYVPQTLHQWLTVQVARGDDAVAAACTMVERGLRTAAACMQQSGFLHFDPHFSNILTDGRHLYLADLGLATTARFDLSAAERHFLQQHLSHDRCYTLTQLVNWLATALCGAKDRNRFIRACAGGADPAPAVGPAAAIIRRYAPVAVVMNAFYRTLHSESRAAVYPVDELRRACAASGVEAGFPPYPADDRHSGPAPGPR